MNHFADQLIDAVKAKGTPVCVGLDPRIESIPDDFRRHHGGYGLSEQKAADCILAFNRQIIDVVAPLVPIVKPQIALYELFGGAGIDAYRETIRYAHERGLLVIGDIKRGDIGSTAAAYAKAHLVSDDGSTADAVTVNPYLGRDSVEPFLDVCKGYGKGLFVLVRTSNPSAKDLQDIDAGTGKVFEAVARHVADWGAELLGESGYSSVGAVVGATWPEEATLLREMMPKTPFLVPGYGAQGGTAADVRPCFDDEGLGAVVNSSRGVIFAHERDPWKGQFGPEGWLDAVQAATKAMIADLHGAGL